MCPPWLDAAARNEWARVIPLLVAGDAVQQCDLAIVAAYCATFSLWSSVQAQLTGDNVAVNGKLNPVARYCDGLLKQLRGLLDQLGFTPAARRQILTGTPKSETLETLLDAD